MAVVFAYTNRYRNIVDIPEGVSVSHRGYPTSGPWTASIQKVSFWQLIPTDNNRLSAPDDLYCRDLYRKDISLADLKADINRYTIAGDYLIVDFDSREPKYFMKKGVKTFRSVRYEELPEYLKDHLDDMIGHGACHLCDGEKLNQASNVALFNCTIQEISLENFRPIERSESDLWAIANRAYYAECMTTNGVTDGRMVLSSELDQVPTELLESPRSIDTPLWLRKQPGEMADSEFYSGLEILVEDTTGFRWTNCFYDGLVLDHVVRFRNPEIVELSNDEVVLYGDLILHTDDTFSIATEPSPEQFGTPVSTGAFLVTSIVGDRVGDRTVLRRRHRDLPLDTRLLFDAYRYLNRDDHVQEGDFQIDSEGLIRPATNVGKKLSENSTTHFRAVGKDGWGVIVRDQITDDMEVQWQVRDRGKVWIDWTPWDQARDHERLQEYERQYYTVYFRKKVHGFRAVRRGDPSFQLPYGLGWVALEDTISSGDLEIINGALHPVVRSSVGKACKDQWIYVRATPNPFHSGIPWPAILSLASPSVEYCGKFLGTVPPDTPRQASDHQLVVSRHGISMIPLRNFDAGTIETPIGNFYPHVFKINGQEQIIYCTDQVNGSELSGLVSRGIASVLGVVQRHMPFVSVVPTKPASATVRREVRAIEL